MYNCYVKKADQHQGLTLVCGSKPFHKEDEIAPYGGQKLTRDGI